MVLFGHFDLRVRDARGRDVPYLAGGARRVLYRLAPADQHDFVTLPPGYIWGHEIALPRGHIALSAPGAYSVSATLTCWETGKGFGLQAWTGTITSPREVLVVTREARGQ
jgi:hypothetical protein